MDGSYLKYDKKVFNFLVKYYIIQIRKLTEKDKPQSLWMQKSIGFEVFLLEKK